MRIYYGFLVLFFLLAEGSASAAAFYNLGMFWKACNPTAFTWTGNGADSNWATAGNWFGNAAPDSTRVAVFDPFCCTGTKCNVTIASSISVAGVNIKVAYPGTITQSAGVTITTGDSGWTQAGGTFSGGNSSITIGGAGNFALSGGSFTSTSGTLDLASKNLTITGGTFAHNSGTLQNPARISAPSGLQLYHFTISGNGMAVIIDNSITVNGSLTVNDISTFPPNGACMQGGSLNMPVYVKKDIILQNYGAGASFNYCPNPVIVVMNGNTNQTLQSPGTSAGLPQLQISSTGGTVTLQDFAVRGGLNVASGSISGSPNVVVQGGDTQCNANGPYTWNTGSLTLASLSFNTHCDSWNGSGTTAVSGNATFQSDTIYGASISGAYFKVAGNLSFAQKMNVNDFTIEMNGTANQTISSTATVTAMPILAMNNTGAGTAVTLSSSLDMASSNFTMKAGAFKLLSSAVSLTGINVLTVPAGTTITKNGGTLSYTTLSGTGTINP